MNSMTIDGVQRNALITPDAADLAALFAPSFALASTKPSARPAIIVPVMISNVTPRHGSKSGRTWIINDESNEFSITRLVSYKLEYIFAEVLLRKSSNCAVCLERINRFIVSVSKRLILFVEQRPCGNSFVREP